MSEQQNGGSAFPRNERTGDGTHYHSHEGMTLRDYFAAKAMQSILTKLDAGIKPQDCIVAAEDAYFVADAMLKARDA